MKKMLFVAACASALAGCADMPQQDKQAQQETDQRFKDDDAVTGSLFPRKKPKAPASAAAQAGGGDTSANSAQK